MPGDCTLEGLTSGCKIIRSYDRETRTRVLYRWARGAWEASLCVNSQGTQVSPMGWLQGTDRSDLVLSLGLGTGGTVTFVSSPGESGARNNSGLLGLALLTDFMGNVVQ